MGSALREMPQIIAVFFHLIDMKMLPHSQIIGKKTLKYMKVKLYHWKSKENAWTKLGVFADLFVFIDLFGIV